jgi:hypothetical protein
VHARRREETGPWRLVKLAAPCSPLGNGGLDRVGGGEPSAEKTGGSGRGGGGAHSDTPADRPGLEVPYLSASLLAEAGGANVIREGGQAPSGRPLRCASEFVIEVLRENDPSLGGFRGPI